MKRLAVLWMVLIAALLPVTATLASDVSNALYRYNIVISNNSTAATGVSTIAAISTPDLIGYGFISDHATDMALRNSTGTDIAFMPGYGTNPMVMFVPSIGASSQTNYVLYTSRASGGQLAYFPDSAGMTCADVGGPIPLGNNFKIEDCGYFDTSAASVGSNIEYNANRYRTYVSAGGGITSSILGCYSAQNLTLIPTGAGDLTQIPSQTPSSTYHWDKVDDPVGSPDNGTTSVAAVLEQGTSYEDDYTHSQSLPPDAVVNSVTVYMRISTPLNGAYSGIVKPLLRLNGTSVYGTARASTGGYSNYSETLSRPGGGSWTPADIASLQIGVQLISNVSAQTTEYVTQVYAVVNYTPGLSVTATGVSSGEHTITTLADGTNLKIFVDGIEKDSAPLNGASMAAPANAVSNGGFETGDPPTGWVGPFSRSTAHVKYGSYSGQMINTGGTSWSLYSFGSPASYAGKTLVFGCWAYATEPNKVFLDWGANSGGGGGESGRHSGSGSWEWLTVTITVPSPCTELHVAVLNTSTVAYAWFDGAVVTASNTCTIAQSAAVPYLYYHKVWASGTLVQDISWNYGDTFTDRSGYGQTCYPSFRTTSSDADVSASVVSFEPVTEAKAPASSLADSPAWITGTPTITGNFTAGSTQPTFPGASIIAALASASATPAQLPFCIIAGFIILVLSLALSGITRQAGNISMLVKGFTIALLMGIAVATGVFDFWMIVVFAYFAVTIALASTDPRWG